LLTAALVDGLSVEARFEATSANARARLLQWPEQNPNTVRNNRAASAFAEIIVVDPDQWSELQP